MVMFICVFLLPIFAVRFNAYLLKMEKDNKDYLFDYFLFFVLINYIILFVMNYIFNNKYVFFGNHLFHVDFAVKYAGLSLVLCIILPLIIYYIKSVYTFELKITTIEGKRNAKRK